MAGAAKRRNKVERQTGQVALQQPTEPPRPTEPNQPVPAVIISPLGPPCEDLFPGGFDGPSDDRSTSDRPAHDFGPSLGYDPARDNAASKSSIPSRLELPAEAYRDSQQYNFPTTLPNRPVDNQQKLGKDIQIRVNQFKVTQWPQKTVYQYDVHIGKGDEKRGLINAVWNCKSVQKGLRNLDRMWLWDGNKIAWCQTKAQKEFRLDLDMDVEKSRTKKEGRDNKTKIRISCVGQVNMAVISAYLNKQMPFDNTVLQAINFLDHCMRQMPTQHYTQIKRSFFHHGLKRVALDGYVEAMKGVYSSMRLCQLPGSFGNSTGLAVNVDVANGTFWIAQTLHQAARNLCDIRHRHISYIDFRNLLKPAKMNDGKLTRSDIFKHLRKMIKLRFSVRHRGKESESKTYTIKDFCFEQKYGPEGGHAKNVKFLLKDKKNPDAAPVETSVYDYFKRQYNIDLEFWYLPLVKTERDGTFPMEVCHILENQSYKFKTDPEQTAAMIKFAVTRPPARIQSVQDGVRMLKWHEDEYLKHYGVQIDPNMTVTKARLLPNPEVQFQGTAKLNPGTTGRWDLRGKKFFTSNPVPLDSWGICILADSVDLSTLANFTRVLIQTYIGHGGKFATRKDKDGRDVKPDPYVMSAPKGETNFGDIAADAWKKTGDHFRKAPQILMFVLPDRNAVTYERLKKNMECRFGIVSQMMQAIHVAKAQPQYCSNICMKINAKLGGSTSRVGILKLNGPSKFFEKFTTMVIGADVSHASPGSPQGSMAAITMSMDKHASRYAAAVQTNGHRVEMITTSNIRSMMMPLFEHWVKTVGEGKVPGHIYYFRDGVSEGQYEHVIQQEVYDMKKCITEKYPSTKIPFTVTVASKRHHLRFFPKDGDFQAGDKNGNSLPGTLVEHDITHPFEYDFYLCSHSAIQGTARPTHYHVILDEAKVPVNIFQSMIYQHCYQFMRSTTPVSLYPAVYYAHIASLRARAHENAPASGPIRGGAKFVEQQQDRTIKAGHVNQPPPSVKSSMDMHTEVLPLIPLGSGAAPVQKETIKYAMWYI